MKIKTASDLKFYHEENHPSSLFFSRNNMKFAGDTMKNFGVRQPVEITTASKDKVVAYELYRRRPVKYNNQNSFWFDMETCERVHKQL